MASRTENEYSARSSGNGGDLFSERAYQALLDRLRDGSLASGRFVSMPVLGEIIGFPIAATREAVKRADAHGLLAVLPKRGVVVMSADAETTRICLDLRAMLDQEGARRRIASGQNLADELDRLAGAHRELLDAARTSAGGLSQRAIETDLSLHDFLAGGLENRLASEAYAVNRLRMAIIQNTRPFLPDRIASAMEEHLAVIAALARGDVPSTVAAIERHHHQTLRWWGIAP